MYVKAINIKSIAMERLTLSMNIWMDGFFICLKKVNVIY